MKHFNLIFWGMIFMFSPRIQGFDVLPDAIGFILIAVGLSGLTHLNPRFEKAGRLSLVLLPLSLLTLYQRPNEENLYNITTWYGIISVLSIFILILYLLLYYYICTGIAEAAEAQNKRELVEDAYGAWKRYFSFNLALIFSIVLLLFSYVLYIIAFLIAGIGAVITTIGVLILVRRAGKQLKEEWA